MSFNKKISDTEYEKLASGNIDHSEIDSINGEISSVKQSLTTLTTEVEQITWTQSSSGLYWTKLPNGLIVAHGQASISSGGTHIDAIGKGYWGSGQILITDIPFNYWANANGDISNLGYSNNLWARFGVNWDRKYLNWSIVTDNPNTSWTCDIIIIGQ